MKIGLKDIKQSGRGTEPVWPMPHSKTWRNYEASWLARQRLGVRQSSAALDGGTFRPTGGTGRRLLQFCSSACLCFFLITGCSGKKEAPAGAPAEKADKEESRVHRGTNGEVIVKLDAETQKFMGLQTAALQPAQISKEIKAFGRALDPSSLVSAVAEVVTAQAASAASQAELQRVKTLATQNNASARALQTAEATAVRDSAQAGSARLRLMATWGASIADRQDLTGFVQSLGKLETALIQLNLPPDETLKDVPSGARIMTVAAETNPLEAKFLGPAASVDPQVQGQGLLFLLSPNPTHVAPGASVTGFIAVPGEKVPGLELPRDAIIRYNGTAWVYVQTAEEEFRRTEVHLETPLPNGWFIREALKPSDKVVTTGAQQILSEELKD